ncbi:MAG: SDR family oxidoreductase [Verrucomicrobiota bacterium]
MPTAISYSCALVTGASAGLGEEFALQLAPRVRQLVLVARREPLLEDLAARIRARVPQVEVVVLEADLTDPAARQSLVAALAARGLQPDLLVNNAGMGDYGEFATAEWPRLAAIIRLNVEALTHLTHALLPDMIRRGRGAILNVSSLAGLLPLPDFAVYAASKAYVTSFSEALRIELREHGIPVLAVCPGPVHTEFGKVAKRGVQGRNMPGREWFYAPKQQVVAEALTALARNRARVYPSLKIAAVAVVLSVVPLVLLRLALGFRPRRQ